MKHNNRSPVSLAIADGLTAMWHQHIYRHHSYVSCLMTDKQRLHLMPSLNIDEAAAATGSQ